MKKAFPILLSVIEILLLSGAYMLYYFSKKKMGMARYVVYKNRIWEEQFPIAMLKGISIVLLVILTLLAAGLIIKLWKHVSKWQILQFICMLVLTGVSVAFMLYYSPQTLRAYYFISPFLTLSALLQTVSALIGTISLVKNSQ